MGKIILFSPVGGTDPISSTNCRDGSLLHICRVYQPDVVYLYMSGEILKNQEQDDRYRYCLDRLAAMTHHPMEYRLIERGNLFEVQDFDFFYQDFRMLMEEIKGEMETSDTLLFNISSGTPAMKSGLLVLATLGEFPCKTVQVMTPARKMNEHIHEDYDVETLWELNEDNQPDFENRCREVHCPTLSLMQQEEMIKKHLQAYHYAAALEVAKSLPDGATKNYIELLEMAQARNLLDYKRAEQIAFKYGMDCFPMKSGNEKKYFEYAMNLEIKLRRKEYVDFIRGITPLVVDLLELILKADTGIRINDYVSVNGKGIRKWDRGKLAGTNVLAALQKQFPDFKYGDIYSIHLKAVIDELSAHAEVKKLVGDLRSVEENIRNIAAHEIISVTEDTIRRKTGFSSKAIMNQLKMAICYGGIKVKAEYWDSYDDMNEMIIQKIQGIG